jgi:hypothetical protein
VRDAPQLFVIGILLLGSRARTGDERLETFRGETGGRTPPEAGNGRTDDRSRRTDLEQEGTEGTEPAIGGQGRGDETGDERPETRDERPETSDFQTGDGETDDGLRSPTSFSFVK